MKLSVVGFPGLALIQHDQQQGTAGLRSALERGVNYFDVAPAYGDGECETKMGIGLEGVDRDSYFLACKTNKRDKAVAREELENSLKLLKTDHFDLYQLHHLRWKDEVERRRSRWRDPDVARGAERRQGQVPGLLGSYQQGRLTGDEGLPF